MVLPRLRLQYVDDEINKKTYDLNILLSIIIIKMKYSINQHFPQTKTKHRVYQVGKDIRVRVPLFYRR